MGRGTVRGRASPGAKPGAEARAGGGARAEARAGGGARCSSGMSNGSFFRASMKGVGMCTMPPSLEHTWAGGVR